MKALITGASSGIGRDMAYYLNNLDYELILVGRDKERLEEVKNNTKRAEIFIADLANEKDVYRLYDRFKKEKIDLLINNAGCGLFGLFNETQLETELKMIDVNIKALHILTKLFLKDFVKRDSGYILNVASVAGFMAGPYLSTYYATKNYVLKLTLAIYEELRSQKSNVHISALCPGPVATDFNNRAGGYFKPGSLNSNYVAKYGIDMVLKGKLIIIPSFKIKLCAFLTRFAPIKLLLKLVYRVQDNKTK